MVQTRPFATNNPFLGTGNGADRWLILVIVPLCTVAGLILTAIIAGTIHFDSDEPTEVAGPNDNAAMTAKSPKPKNE